MLNFDHLAQILGIFSLTFLLEFVNGLSAALLPRTCTTEHEKLKQGVYTCFLKNFVSPAHLRVANYEYFIVIGSFAKSMSIFSLKFQVL